MIQGVPKRVNQVQPHAVLQQQVNLGLTRYLISFTICFLLYYTISPLLSDIPGISILIDIIDQGLNKVGGIFSYFTTAISDKLGNINIVLAPFYLLKDYIIMPIFTTLSDAVYYLMGVTSKSKPIEQNTTKTTDELIETDILDNDENIDQTNTTTEATEKGKSIIDDNMTLRKMAFRLGKKQALQKYKNIGAQSLTPENIANAQAKGREEVLLIHERKGAQSVTETQTTKAYERGRKQEIQRHQDMGKDSLSNEEIDEIYKKVESQLKNEAINRTMQSPLFVELQSNALDAAYISLLRTIESSSQDHEIIDKATFCMHLTQCLYEHSATECSEMILHHSGLTYNMEICP